MSAQRVPSAGGVWGLGIFGGLMLLVVSSAQAADPTDKAQCMSMTRAPLEAECQRLFGAVRAVGRIGELPGGD